MKEKQMKRVIDSYIKAYNEFDVDEMVKNIHHDVEFKNFYAKQYDIESYFSYILTCVFR